MYKKIPLFTYLYIVIFIFALYYCFIIFYIDYYKGCITLYISFEMFVLRILN